MAALARLPAGAAARATTVPSHAAHQRPSGSPWRQRTRQWQRVQAAGEELGSSSACADTAEPSASLVQQTLHNLDALLGEAATSSAAPGAPAPAVAPSAAEEVPAAWAHLSAEEVSKRQALARRHRDLAARQTAVAAELADQERRAAHFHERCIVLRREKLDLLRQQRVLEEAIDPEGTALTRMAAEQARRAEAEEVRREALRAAVAFWALMGLLTLAHEHLPAISGAGMVVDGMVL